MNTTTVSLKYKALLTIKCRYSAKLVDAETTSGFTAAATRNVLPCRPLFTRRRAGRRGSPAPRRSVDRINDDRTAAFGLRGPHNTGRITASVVWSATAFPVVVHCRSVSEISPRHCWSSWSTGWHRKHGSLASVSQKDANYFAHYMSARVATCLRQSWTWVGPIHWLNWIGLGREITAFSWVGLGWDSTNCNIQWHSSILVFKVIMNYVNYKTLHFNIILIIWNGNG